MLSREEIDEDCLHLHERCVDIYNGLSKAPVYKKSQRFFFMANDKCRGTKADLCDFLVWCKHSHITEESSIVEGVLDKIPILKYFRVAILKTFFVNGFLYVQALTNADKCKVIVVNGDETAQIRVIRDKNFHGKIMIGVSICIPHLCMECKKMPSDTCKLRFCSRCFKVDRVRVFYCSKECQKQDYPRHSNACNVDWNDNDWRERDKVLHDYWGV